MSRQDHAAAPSVPGSGVDADTPVLATLTVHEIARIVGGSVHGMDPGEAARTRVTGPVVADSREAVPGSLFLADGAGHRFAGDAVARGAVVVLGSEPIPGLPMVLAPTPAGESAAPDRDPSVLALGVLGRELVQRVPGLRVLALTGSSGKTGTKDMLADVLSGYGPTVAPAASLNDELGVPLTALRVTDRTRHLVLEMGARGQGHIAYLTGLVAPSVGIVLNVGSAHAGPFGGQAGIARAKGEMVQALPKDGTAVLNADDPWVRAMAERTVANVVLVGEAADAEVRATDVSLDTAGCAAFTLVTPEASASVRLHLVGRHQVANALAVAAAARAVGMPLDAVAAELSASRRRARWRMEVSERPDGVTVVNDGYNANPDSMAAALRAVRALAGERRTWAVLGEMLELGSDGPEQHGRIGRLAGELGFDRVVAVGDGGHPIADGAAAAGATVHTVADRDEARRLLDRDLVHGDVVLVKSSRDAGLRYLGDALLEGTSVDREESTP